MNPHAEFLQEKHSLAELKAFAKEHKIRGFSGLNKATIKELIYKHGEAGLAESESELVDIKEDIVVEEPEQVKKKVKKITIKKPRKMAMKK
jgi:hypothetical protein